LSIANIKGSTLVGGKVKMFFKPLSATKTRYFDYFHSLQPQKASHMKRSASHIEQNTCDIPPIFTIPYELIIAITVSNESAAVVPFKGHNLELLVVGTCKHLYELYKQHYKEQTTLVLYHPEDERSLYSGYIKSLYRDGNQRLWLRTRFISISDYKDDNYPMKILCLNQMFDLPDGLNFKSFDALIMIFYCFRLRKFTADSSFLEKFSKLTSITLKNDYYYSYVDKLTLPNRLLKSISLHGFEMNNPEPKPSDSYKKFLTTPYVLPLLRLPLQVDFSNSTQLQSL
jgi:hypothetical protein